MGKRIECTIYTIKNYFEKIDTSDKAYFLGFIGSDGCIYTPKIKNKQKIIKITIQKEDIKILHLFNSVLESNKPISESKNKYVSLEISSDKLANDLHKLGLDSNKTYNNTIAIVDNEYMPHLIRGYFDGDGSIHYNEELSKSGISIAGYKRNMNKIISYLDGRNIFTTFAMDKRKYNSPTDDSFGCISFPNKTSEYCFLKLIYENCGIYYMDRKYDLAQKFINRIETSKNIRDKQIVAYYNNAVQKLG